MPYDTNEVKMNLGNGEYALHQDALQIAVHWTLHSDFFEKKKTEQ